MRFTLCTAAALPALLLASVAAADGVCDSEYKSTPAEVAAMSSALTTLMAAVPGAPEGWVVDGDDQPKGGTSFCLDGSGDGLLPYSHTRRLRRTAGLETREDAIAAAGADMRASMAQKKPQMDLLEARLAQISTAFGEAAVKGDTARLAALNVEMTQVNAEFQALLAQDESTAKFQASAAAASRDFHSSTSVAVNPSGAGPAPDAKPMAPPAGAAAAFRWVEGYDAHALVLVGEWKTTDDGLAYEIVPRSGAPKHVPHGVAVTLSADVDRGDSLVGSVDFAAMTRALGR